MTLPASRPHCGRSTTRGALGPIDLDDASPYELNAQSASTPVGLASDNGDRGFCSPNENIVYDGSNGDLRTIVLAIIALPVHAPL